MVKKTTKTGVSSRHKTGKSTKAADKPKASNTSIKQRATEAKSDNPVRKPLPNAFRITASAARLVWEHKILFGGISLMYGILVIVLVQGLSGGTNVTGLKELLNNFFTGHFGSIASGLTIFVVLLGSVGSNASGNGAYQFVLTLITSLAIIWGLRQVKAGSNPSIKDAFYKGMYPLIPLLFVLLIVGIELLPLLAGSAIYNAAMGGTAVGWIEKGVFIAVYAALGIWSGYMLSSSLFAIYIVTLPEMTPLKALRSARNLVKGRRWSIVRKVIFLPFALLIGGALIMLPIILIATPLARWIFFILSTFIILAVHSYMYTIYRELIDD